MQLIKVSLLNGISVALRMAALLFINKLLALYCGPTGYVIIGQFQNSLQILQTLSGGALSSGVVKFTAEYKEQPDKESQFIATSSYVLIGLSALVSILTVFFSSDISVFFLGKTDYAYVYLFVAISLFAFTANTFFVSILNGKQEIVLYVYVNIAGTFFILLSSALLLHYFGLDGGLVALATHPIVSLVATLLILRGKSFVKDAFYKINLNRSMLFDLSKFFAMAIATSICVPTSQIYVRDILITEVGVQSAGYWDAMWRLSSSYLLFGTSILGVYFIPKMAMINDRRAMLVELFSGILFIAPLTALSCLLIYTFRMEVIYILFSEEFYEMELLFFYQLMGDFAKLISWVVGCIFISKARASLFIFIEMFFSLSFVLLTSYFVDNYGLEGVALAHFVNYILCLAFVLIVLWRDGHAK